MFNPIHEEEGEWYFWDETGMDRFGPYDSETTARHELALYGLWLTYGEVRNHLFFVVPSPD